MAEDVSCTKKNYLKALQMIREKDTKLRRIDQLHPQRKIRVINFCNWDVNIKNARRSNLDILPSKMQSLLMQLKTSASKHDWSSVARCIHFMLDTKGILLPVIWRSVLLVLLHHPRSSKQNLVDFLQMVLCLRTSQEQEKFIEDLLTLPENLDIYHSSKGKATTTDEIYCDEEDE